MKAGLAIALLTALAGVALVSACAEEELVLARLPPSNDSGPPVEAKRCVDDAECTATSFCARAECGDVAGTCAARPVVCEEAPQPVCGCDGITYWNDCLRRAAGITARAPRECEPGVGPAQTCGGPGDRGPGPGPSTERCPPGTFCARLLPPSPPGAPPICPPAVPGTCWALPAVCPPFDPNRWTRCGAPALECKTTCDAIHTGEPHQRANACP